jgi:hypothetical protein
MANRNLQKIVEDMEYGQSWANQPNVYTSTKINTKGLSLNAPEYVPLPRKNPPIRMTLNNIEKLKTMTKEEKEEFYAPRRKYISGYPEEIYLPSANNAKKIYAQKMKNYEHGMNQISKLTGSKQNNIKSRKARKSRKSRKNRKSRKSRK